MVNATVRKFGYPDSLIYEYEHWVVMLRPKQATLGALILACKQDVTAFSDISEGAFREMQVAVKAIETTLGHAFSYQKINYLMLMMVDPHVHFHVLPRYESERSFEGVPFVDPAWPGPPDIGHATEMESDAFERLRDKLRHSWK